MPICYIQPVIDNSVRQLCYRPYANHSKGCPNYGKRITCPPQAPIFSDVFDLKKPIMAVWTAFNLAQHREKMLIKHPEWTRRQLDCCLYWQGRVNKNLRREVQYNLARLGIFNWATKLISTFTPEAMGINVTATMFNAGIIFEWPPDKIVIKVAFVGVPVQKKPL